MLSPRISPCIALSLGLACGSDPSAEGSDTTGAATSGSSDGGSESSGELPTGDGTTSADTCTDGVVVCVEGGAQICEGGVFGAAEPCAGGCIDGVGCVSCEPGSTVCDGDEVALCGEDGEPGEAVAECDPVQGLRCEAGACVGACAADPLRGSEAGCEFYAVPMPSENVAEGGFGVALTNTCEAATNLAIDAAGMPLLMSALMAGETRFVELPRLPPLYAANMSVVTGNGAYRVRTDCPVLAVQYSGGKASIDASRLYPAASWGTEARVMTQPSSMVEGGTVPAQGYFVVTARDDETTVTVDVPVGIAVGAIGTIPVGGDGQIVLDRGETLLLIAELPHDMAGAHVTADRPIGVFGGHECASLPLGVGFCDHVEEVMPPGAALGTEYVVMAPVGSDGSGTAVPHVVRVIGTQDGTQVTTSDAMLSGQVDAGGVLEFGPITTSLRVTGSAPVLVGQFLVGIEEDPLASDPSLLVPPPVDQFREEHALWTAEGWALTVVQVVGAAGVAATIDGAEVAGWAAIEGTEYVGTSVVIAEPGGHVLVADGPVGVSVIGVQTEPPVASYGYSGAWEWPVP